MNTKVAEEMFTCAIESCGFSAPAEKMWNLDRKETSGKLVVVCSGDAQDARRRGFRAYRLADTLRRDAERKAERDRARSDRDQFYARFGHPRIADALRAAGNGHGATEEATAPPATK